MQLAACCEACTVTGDPLSKIRDGTEDKFETTNVSRPSVCVL